MSDLDILKQTNPDLGEYLECWRTHHQRLYDLTQITEQSNFHEAILDIARHMAKVSQNGNLSLQVSNNGVTGLVITVTPNA
jgi:hypothetical protein